MPIRETREYRNFKNNFEFRAAEDETAISYEVEGLASTFDDPYLLFEYNDAFEGKKVEVWEKVDRDAFKEADISDTVFQYNHGGHVFARTKNGTLKLEANETGLEVRADLGGTQGGRDMAEEIRGGYIDKMSIGFTVAEDVTVTEEDPEKILVTRTITKVKKLYDVSAVDFPANPNTDINARSMEQARQDFVNKALSDLRIQKRRAEIIERIKSNYGN
jgi:HK97 family phage prohead protease